ncbi:MFS transporter [Roseburia hominis]
MLQVVKKYMTYINRPIIIIYVIFFLYFVVEESLGIVVPLFFDERNISIVLYGILLSFTKMARAIVVIPISLKPVESKMKCLKITLFFDMIVFVVLIYTKSPIVTFIGFSILFITTSIINVILNPLLGTKADKNHIGIIFGIRDAFLYAGCFLGLLIIGIIKTMSTNTNLVWIFYSCIFVLVLFSVCSLEKEIVDKEECCLRKSNKQEDKVTIKGTSKELIFFCSILFVLGIGGACVNFVPLVAADVGVKVSNIFYVFSTSTFISSLLSITGGITLDKFNKKLLFQVDIVLLLLLLIMYSSGNSWILTIAIIISGISSVFDNASNIYVFANYSEDEVNCFWGIIGSVNLISFSIGTFLCGMLYEINFKFVFLFGILLNIVGLTMSLKLKNIEK